MRELHWCVSSLALVAGCSCHDTGILGTPDSVVDSEDDGEPRCRDLDGDGHEDAACGGDDCDDLDPGIHPGADEVCLDGVDQDCDGIVDGPVRMGGVLQVSRNTAGLLDDRMFAAPVWTGDTYAVSWKQVEASGEIAFYLGHIGADGGGVVEARRVDRLMSLAWTSTLLGTVWSDPGGIYARVMGRLGEPVTGDVPVATGLEGSPLWIAWTGERFDLFCDDATNTWPRVMHAAVSDAGDPLSMLGEISSIMRWEMWEPREWCFAWTGRSAVFLWIARDYEGGSRYFLSWQPDGDGPAEHVRVDADIWDSYQAMAWTGSEFGVLRQELPDPPGPFDTSWFTRLDERGSRVVEDREIDLNFGHRPKLAWTGSRFAVLYGDLTMSLAVAVGDAEGSFEPGSAIVEVSEGYYGHGWDELAWTGSELGVTWQDAASGVAQVFFCRVGFCE